MAARIFALVCCLNLALVPARAEPIPLWQPPINLPSLPTALPLPNTVPPVPPVGAPSGPAGGDDGAAPPAAPDQLLGGGGTKFQPDGSSPGFFCEYPSLSSQWQACNGPDSRDCWLRKAAPKVKVQERCGCEDDDHEHDDGDVDDSKWGDVIDVHTNCECVCFLCTIPPLASSHPI